jgi:GWxTD domain-containing protein
LFIIGCSALNNSLSNQNLATIYNPAVNTFGLRFKPFFLNDTTLRIYYRFQTDNLLYLKEAHENELQAMVNLHIRISDSYDSRVTPDTFSFDLQFKRSITQKTFSSHVDLKASAKKNYLLYLLLNDTNRKTKQIALSEVNHLTHAQADFYLTDANGTIIPEDWIEENTTFYIHCNNIASSSLTVRYFPNIYQTALPPFVQSKGRIFDRVPDSTFTVPLQSGSSPLLSFHSNGIYLITLNTLSDPRHFHLFISEPGFPNVMLVRHMLGPMRYLTTRQEYDKLESQESIKKAIDDFWILNSGSPERAREMIRKYFSRVQEANEMFTSVYEGWKTDRGMIYIIYGAPTILYRNEKGETWIYGEQGNLYSVTLNFSKVKTPFTDNEYVLNRSATYKESWYNAVDIWRR